MDTQFAGLDHIGVAVSDLEAAKANVVAAQAKLDALLAGPDADAVSIAQASLAAANARFKAAQANHDLLLKGPSEDQIAAAEANLAQAEAYLEALRRALGLSRGMAGDIRDGVSED